MIPTGIAAYQMMWWYTIDLLHMTPRWRPLKRRRYRRELLRIEGCQALYEVDGVWRSPL